MKQIPKSDRAPLPSKARTNRDPVMILVGIMLVVFSLAAGYSTWRETTPKPAALSRGPVKDPGVGLTDPLSAKQKPHQTGLQGNSMPFPDRGSQLR